MIGRTIPELGLWANPEQRAEGLAVLRAGGSVREWFHCDDTAPPMVNDDAFSLGQLARLDLERREDPRQRGAV